MILAGISIIFGIFVIASGGGANFLGGGVAVIAGMYAFDSKTFTPLIVGFVIMWILRLLGFDKSGR